MHMWDKFAAKEGLVVRGGKPALNLEQFQEFLVHAAPGVEPGSKRVALLFKIFDQDRDGVVGFREWVNGFSTVFFGTVEDKMRQVFCRYNKNGDGHLLESELVEMLQDVYALGGSEVQKDPRAIAHDMLLNSGVAVSKRGPEPVMKGATFSQFYSFIHMEPLVYENLAFDVLLMNSESGGGSSAAGIRSARRMSAPLHKMVTKRMSFIFDTASLAKLQQFDEYTIGSSSSSSSSSSNKPEPLSEIGTKTFSSLTSSGRRPPRRKDSHMNEPLLQGVGHSESFGNENDVIDEESITPEPNFTWWDLAVRRFYSWFCFCGCCSCHK